MKEKIKNHIKEHKIIYSALLILFCFSGLILSFNKIELTDTGSVLKVGDGIATVYGLENVMSSELLKYI